MRAKRSAAGVRRAENAADARSRDAGNRYAMLLENLKNAEMREAARKAAAQSDADTWPTGQWALYCAGPACGSRITREVCAILRCGER